MAHLLNDFPSGPLDHYRKRASFDWKKMKIFIDTEEMIEYQHEIYNEISKYPVLYEKSLHTPPFDEFRRISTKRMYTLKSIDMLQFHNIDSLRKPQQIQCILMQLDPSSYIKYSIPFGLFTSVVRSMGTKSHMPIVAKALDGEITGCFCLTEIAHGSNTKGMRTTATYDKDTKQFILHTPDFQAAKCWAGSLGQCATHAVVFAHLITPDNVAHGLHVFVVPIRDQQTLKPFPGVTVGDMGEKIGLNGVDNGFIMFDHYAIPRTALLNRTGDVMEDGTYVSPYKDPNKRHGASLGSLSVGRVNITGMCAVYAGKAISIAIRYAAVRKQFGPEGEEEIPILEYQTHQHRLLPYLAMAYSLRIFANDFMKIQYQFSIDSMAGKGSDELADLGLEMHALSSASKPVAGWIVRDCTQECREACAGHGYLKVSGLGDIKNDHDANCTYEGENHILIQQTSNWLLKLWPLVLQRKTVSSPLKSVDFITNATQILRSYRFTSNTIEETILPQNIINAYQWLVCHLLKSTHEKYEENLRQGLDLFAAKNDSQVFYAKSMSVAYIEHFILQRLYMLIQMAEDLAVKKVLLRVFSLYGIWSLEKHLGTLYEGGYATGKEAGYLIRESILKLCGDLKDDAVALVDAIAPPDFILNSVLGYSDGQVYKHLEHAIMQAPGSMSRPAWWKEITCWKENVKSKL